MDILQKAIKDPTSYLKMGCYGGLWLRDIETGLIKPNTVCWNKNHVMDSGIITFMKNRSPSGSALNIAIIAVGGFTGGTATMAAITDTDTTLENELESDSITSFDDTALISPTFQWKAKRTWESAEANATLYEVGLKFDDGALFARAFLGRGDITGATQANPVAITSTAHGLSTGDKVHIKNVGGMTQINDTTFTVTNTGANTFTLDGEDGTGHTAYTSGGTWNKVVVKTSGEVAESRHALAITRA